MEGALAQLVEQWTENPCVPGSIPGGTTEKPEDENLRAFCFSNLSISNLAELLHVYFITATISKNQDDEVCY